MSFTLNTIPASIPFGNRETWSPGIDCTNYLSPYAPDTVPTDPVVTLAVVNQPTQTVTLTDPPVVTGVIVTQRIPVSILDPGSNYQLTLTFVPSGTADVLEAILVLTCPANS